jgi:hypothetical protein
MDFSNRNVQPSVSGRTAPAAGVPPVHGSNKPKDATWNASPKWIKIVWITLLFGATILLVSVAALLIFGKGGGEAKHVDESKVQAVFLENGQVYFGKVRTINDKYMDLYSIYYLSVDRPVQPEQAGAQQQGNITLQKLGCELHGPVDQMVVNRDHVTFWENLRDDGQVAKAIAQWAEQNPDGLKCPEPGEQQQDGEQAAEEENQENQ